MEEVVPVPELSCMAGVLMEARSFYSYMELMHGQTYGKKLWDWIQ